MNTYSWTRNETVPLADALRAPVAISADEDLVDLRTFDLGRSRADLQDRGFTICKGLVTAAVFSRVQNFWIDFYRKASPQGLRPISWSPYWGEENFTAYTDNSFNLLYRTYDFLWNIPYDLESRTLCLALNKLRNRLVGQDDIYGTLISPDGYGIYNTTSLYPDTGGWMSMHDDGVAPGAMLVHFIMPITFCGTHYASGGMRVVDRSGKEFAIDDMVEPGDVIFYDGSLPHGVARLSPTGKSDGIGRIQLFAIPTRFTGISRNSELYRQLRTVDFLKAKAAVGIAATRRAIKSKSSYRS